MKIVETMSMIQWRREQIQGGHATMGAALNAPWM